ncbi:MAG: hypothetical protein IPK26_12170 [Planctomycetes bacterium]|nr:hypothetical protein [Planctomycetota bacterium]
MKRLSDRNPTPDELYLADEVRSPIRREWVGGVAEVHEGLEAVVPLPEIEARLSLAAVYDGVSV